ncbi:MAG: Tim44/TimA family putative adaptor protein [Roseibium album]|uniref:Mitochondrial import inner membrane, translocase subunit n=1 Tax=Roseibium album TaxID=311410 RepID=A0A0M7A0E0_9HYPH|nr:Tim44/TimA family putative adaptor protein [Roseibium album]MBG6145493.1 putative lipid-binding transport protein (Tim44 family) [Labrenzia sp. EL_142]MBG6157814.1 putative lipid-binding transport protein (Tim44 family) [Labrenzia sp. EL_162]MBG6163243.1 putative lipid-binding transport protein (Tim44 family) [Labrenzia sp. EL_195]MBG6174361.1 putative lipid-binding transport protein (Tim44 family) [Labrenzia sp. EL_132]MBG6195793.1 putative lipid-binding transport protein (Tim44 family) [L
MNEIFDPLNLLLLGLAVFILFRLRSVLGKRTGNERPPFDPYSKPEQPNEQTNGQDNVIPLPNQTDQPAEMSQESAQGGDVVIDKVAPEGSALNSALKQILSVDRSFEPQEFLQGARAAYEMIVMAFADGDKKALKNLLSSDVYEGFVGAIEDREKRGETIESTFVGIDKAEIVEAALKNSTAQVTVKIHSQLISATRDKEGEVVDGDPAKVTEVVDIWTFARDTMSRDPNWKLVATESAE